MKSYRAWIRFSTLALGSAFWAVSANGRAQVPTYVSTATFTASPAGTATSTSTQPVTFTPAATPSPTQTPTDTAPPTPTASPTGTFTAVLSPTDTPTATPSITPTPPLTETPTVTAIPTFTFTPTATFSPTPTSTPALAATPIPTPGGGCHGNINTYSYPNPAPGSDMDIRYDLCEPGSADIRIYNAAGNQVVSYPAVGNPGVNILPVDISGYSHGIYYYLVRSRGPSGARKSKPTSFAVTRSP